MMKKNFEFCRYFVSVSDSAYVKYLKNLLKAMQTAD